MKTAKFWIAAIGGVLTTLAGLGLTGTAQTVVTIAAAVLSALAVYAIPNARAVTPPADGTVRR